MSGPRLSIIPAGAAVDARLEGRWDLKVLCLLGTYTDDDGWCFRSQTTMAEQLGCARTTVQRALDRLEGAGWIERRGRLRDDGATSANYYRVMLDTVDDGAGPSPRRAGAAGPPAHEWAGARPSQERAGIRTTPELTRKRESAGAGGEGQEGREAAEACREQDRRDVEAKLAAFRPIWPTTRSDDAQAVDAAMRALSAEDRAAALAGVPVFLAAQKADGRKHTVNGANYLSRRRWEPAVAAKEAAREAAGPAGGGAAGCSAFAPAWSKRWWAALIVAVETGRLTPFEMRRRVSAAKNYKAGWKVEAGEVAAIDARAAALTPSMTNEPRAKAWAAWFRNRKVDLDEALFGKPFAIFLPPGDPPPDGPGLGLDDEVLDGFCEGGR